MSGATPTLNLDAYFDRSSYSGSRTPSFGTLASIHAHHVHAIPFENLDILLGRGIRIDVPAIEQKLVRDRRGGYCFEQNTLLAAALRALGFGVTPLLARVRWQLPPETQTPLTHMVLRVETPDAGICIADVGFGSMSLSQPLRLAFDGEQPGGLEPRRLVRRGDLIVQQAKLGDMWGDVYLFTLTEAPAIDFEVSNWYTSASPQSAFLHNLRVARTLADRRHTLLNRDFTTRFPDGRVEKRTLATPVELLDVLAEFFGLHFPPGTRFGQPGAPWPQ